MNGGPLLGALDGVLKRTDARTLARVRVQLDEGFLDLDERVSLPAGYHRSGGLGAIGRGGRLGGPDGDTRRLLNRHIRGDFVTVPGPGVIAFARIPAMRMSRSCPAPSTASGPSRIHFVMSGMFIVAISTAFSALSMVSSFT